MFKWLRNRKKPPPDIPHPALKGSPTHPRAKTYSATNGYVYQYVYSGYRTLADGDEYVFQASRGRDRFPVRVRVTHQELGGCEVRIGRKVLNQERYALAKMALFSAFDSADSAGGFDRPVAPDAATMTEYLQTLGRL